jgi:hypothetical protein
MTSSPLTEPLVDINDVDIEMELSRALTPASTSLSLPLGRKISRPSSSGLDFFGHSF